MHNVCREDMTGPRFARAGLALAAYEQLRFSRVDWRRLSNAIASTIAGPLLRRHRLRSVSVRMWLTAICGLDCGDDQTRRHDRTAGAGRDSER